MDIKKDNYHTIADIEALPDGQRAELIDGVIYDMAPPSRIHQRLVTELSTTINNYIRQKGGNCEVYVSPFAVYLKDDDTTYVEPDVVVICDKNKLDDKGCHGAPDFIIEIVSPESVARDYMTKMSLYMNAGVREYWIVDPAKNNIRVYSFEKESTEDYSFDQNVEVGIYDDLMINVNSILSTS